MRISGRLAFHAEAFGSTSLGGTQHRLQVAPASSLFGYDGADVALSQLSETGFAAEFGHALPVGAIVRLKLPGSGVMLAKITASQRGKISAEFLNPLNPARLRKTFGWQSLQRIEAGLVAA